MPKSRVKTAAADKAAEREALVLAATPEDWAVAEIRRALRFQMEQIRMNPSKTMKAAKQKARDSRSLSELLRTLERLDAAEKRREGKARKAGPSDDRDDKAIKDEFVRRLDQLLAARDKGDVPRKS